MGRKPRRLGASAIVLALAASGCAAQGGGENAAAPADCGTTLKFGILTSLTGEFAQFGRRSKKAMELAIQEMRSSSAVSQEWTIETAAADTQTKVEPALRGATNLIQNENASVVLGPFSGAVVALVPITERTQTPIVTMFGSTVKLDRLGGEWIYRTIASDTTEGLVPAKWFVKEGRKRVVAMASSQESAVSAAKAMRRGFEESGGQVLDIYRFDRGQPTYQALVEKVMSTNPDAIYLAAGQESGVTILNNLLDAGFPAQRILGSSDLPVPDVVKALGAERAEGLQAVVPTVRKNRTAYERFAGAYQDKYGEEPWPFVPNAYDATNVAGLAAVAARSTCGNAINSKIRKVANPPGVDVTTFSQGAKLLDRGKDIDYVGASGPVNFDKSGTVLTAYGIMEVKNGKWTQVNLYPAKAFTEE